MPLSQKSLQMPYFLRSTVDLSVATSGTTIAPGTSNTATWPSAREMRGGFGLLCRRQDAWWREARERRRGLRWDAKLLESLSVIKQMHHVWAVSPSVYAWTFGAHEAPRPGVAKGARLKDDSKYMYHDNEGKKRSPREAPRVWGGKTLDDCNLGFRARHVKIFWCPPSSQKSNISR